MPHGRRRRAGAGRTAHGPWSVALCLLLVVPGVGCGPAPNSVVEGRLSVASALGGSAEGYARAVDPRPFIFPADHGGHPDHRNEWWYFTGNLDGSDGRHWGYQLTFFRVAIAPGMPPRDSAWASRQVYMAHFALTDVEAGRFHGFERFSRAALGLAGVRARPFRVWLEDWAAAPAGASVLAGEPPAPVGAEVRIEADSDPGRRRAATATLLPLRLRAASDGVALDLTLRLDKPLVLQGEGGLSRKGGGPGNASYYYSVTRMRASGDVTVDERRHTVSGLGWLDREWSTAALEDGQVGWDWFSLQLDDGRDLMLYLLRREDGAVDPFSSGSVVERDGTVRSLRRGDFRVEVLQTWRSPRGGVYPARWRLRVPGAGIDVEVAPWLADQELDVAVRYWEGAVRVRGTSAGRPTAGNGYVELTGYAE